MIISHLASGHNALLDQKIVFTLEYCSLFGELSWKSNMAAKPPFEFQYGARDVTSDHPIVSCNICSQLIERAKIASVSTTKTQNPI